MVFVGSGRGDVGCCRFVTFVGYFGGVLRCLVTRLLIAMDLVSWFWFGF